jgi:hypothetical protein
MDEDWERLAAEVRQARLALGFAGPGLWAEELERAGSTLKYKTLLRIENGRRVGADSLAGLELALGWPAGAAMRVARGERLADIVSASVSVENAQAGPRPELDITTEQILDLVDYAESKIGKAFARELLRWAVDGSRARKEGGETTEVTRRDAV